MTYWSDFLEQKWNSKHERKQVLNKEKRMQDKNTIDIIILPTNIKKRKPSKKKRKVYKTPHLHTANKERGRE